MAAARWWLSRRLAFLKSIRMFTDIARGVLLMLEPSRQTVIIVRNLLEWFCEWSPLGGFQRMKDSPSLMYVAYGTRAFARIEQRGVGLCSPSAYPTLRSVPACLGDIVDVYLWHWLRHLDGLIVKGATRPLSGSEWYWMSRA